MDPKSGEVFRDDAQGVKLNTQELRVLNYLVARPRTPVARTELHQAIWDVDLGTSERAVDFAVSRLKAKIESPSQGPRHLLQPGPDTFLFDPGDEQDMTASGTGPLSLTTSAIRLAGCTLDISGRRLLAGASQLHLSSSEALLLRRLAQHLGETVALDQLQLFLDEQLSREVTLTVEAAIQGLQEKLSERAGTPSDLLVVEGDGIRLESPEPTAPGSRPRTNLWPDGSHFVGRDAELADLWENLSRPGRLVMIVGPAGCGKSRLANHFGNLELAQPGRWPGGVWTVELSHCRTLAEVASEIADSLQFATQRTPSLTEAEALATSFEARERTLLVLDHVEQLEPDALALVSTLLERSGNLLCLATSRQQLSLPGETVLNLGPLPPEGSAELFVERGRALGWTPRSNEHESIARIVSKLDHIPLAVELAAGHLRSVSVASLLKRLEAGLELPAHPRTDRPRRHATWRAAIGWSWDLLSPPQQATLAEISIFRGGFSLEAAEAVVAIERPVAEVLAELCEHSLLEVAQPDEMSGEFRFRQYEPVRQFGALKLRASGNQRATVERHVRHFLIWGEEQVGRLDGPNGFLVSRQLRTDRENLLAALRRLEGSDPHRAARAALVLEFPLASIGAATRLSEILDAAVRLARASGDRELLARAMVSRGRRMSSRVELPEAKDRLSQAAEMARELGLEELEASARMALARTRRQLGDYDGARGEIAAALSLAQRIQSALLEARALISEGVLLSEQGDHAGALQAHRRALGGFLATGAVIQEVQGRANLGSRYMDARRWDEAEEQFQLALQAVELWGDTPRIALALDDLARVAVMRGHQEQADTYIRRVLEIQRSFGNLGGEAWSTSNLGALCIDRGKFEEAQTLLERSIELHRRRKTPRGEAYALTNLGACALLQQGSDRALELLLLAEHIAGRLGDRMLLLTVLGYLSVAQGNQGDASLNRIRSLLQPEDPETPRIMLRLCEALYAQSQGESDGPEAVLAWCRSNPGEIDQDGRVLRSLLETRLQAGLSVAGDQ